MEQQEIQISITNKYPHLKKQLHVGENFKHGNTKDICTKENIKDGLKKFYNDHQRYPTALEIDHYEFLPSSRQIQRSFGGLVKLRQEFGLEIVHYGQGTNRSAIATDINIRARKAEIEMEDILVSHFGEYFVHTEKPLYKYYNNNLAHDKRRNKARADFFIYCKECSFCVDVFCTNDIHNFRCIINLKEPNYTGLKIKTYLVNMHGEGINQSEIDTFKKHRLKVTDDNIVILDKHKFTTYIKTLTPIKVA